MLVGLEGTDYQDPAAFDVSFGRAVWVGAALLVLGGVVSWLMISDDVAGPAREPDEAHRDPDECTHCALDAPPLAARRAGARAR